MSFLLSCQSATVCRRAHGFTLIEVMVVVATMAVLATLAAPSFTPLMERWRVRQAAEELQSTLYYARSEAIKRGGSIAIADDSGQWSNGWKVFFDANNNGSQDACVPANNPNECDLQVTAAPSKASVSLAGGNGTITLDRWGMLSHSGGGDATSMDFLIVPEGKSANDTSATRLCAGQGGRIVQKKGSESCL
ncbi:GspH/FimT family pseudopilin [Acidovorax sp. SRB_24]|uniref:GspH/FimT family pseudopilin n=1 Tax=Acidovorax sp. SRB_24 TaxID=1962700 RepID=UPI00145E39A7|nr:GspH/FimT family pseudopilin [Acidovorax sp. SRB_24]